jgi:hypothetical protein
MSLRQICAQISLGAVLCLMAKDSAMDPQKAPDVIPAAKATVADIKGKVQIELPGQGATVPSREQVLPSETVITTKGGRMLLQLEDGSQILVYDHTRVVLKQPVATNWQRLQLLLGKIKAEIQKRTGGSPPFKLGTPSAVITVRGTRFFVQVDKHRVTRVTVEEGVVEVESAKRVGKPLQIKAGFSTRVKEDSDPDPAQQAPGQQREDSNSRDRGSQGQRPNSPGPRGRRP